MTSAKKSGSHSSAGKTLSTADSEAGQAFALMSGAILDSLSANICVLDAEGTIIAVNRAWQQFGSANGGFPEALNQGANYFAACRNAVNQAGQADAGKAARGIKQVLAGQLSLFEMEYDCHSPEQKRWFLMRVTPLQYAGKKAVVAHIDMTEKILAEEELSALYSINRSVAATLTLGAVTESIMEQVAAVLKPDLCLIFLRKGDQLRLHGLRPDAVLMSEDKLQAHRVGECLCGIAVSTMESVFSVNINEDPRCSYPECKAAGLTSFAAIPLIRSGEVIGTIGIAAFDPRDFSAHRRFLEAVATDVAIVLENSLLLEKANKSAQELERQLENRKRLEEQLVQAQKMEAIGALAAGMAHEINNPLAGILQNNQLLKRRLLSELPQNQAAAESCGTSFSAISRYMQERRLDRVVQAIGESGERAAKIVQDVLSFSRKDSEHMVACDVRELLDNALELAGKDYSIASKYDFRKVKVVRDYATELPLVICNPFKVQQVFFNILKNAADAMCTKTYLADSPRLQLKVHAFDKDVRVEIEDNGPGMDEETKRRIFEPFFTTKPVGKGTGLGLSVSYFIVTENQRGRLQVETEPGHWTRFLISLPVSG